MIIYDNLLISLSRHALLWYMQMDSNRLWMYESKGLDVYNAGVLELFNFAISNEEEGRSYVGSMQEMC